MIVDGARRGQNLFHSFEKFNVSENRGAYFAIPDSNVLNVLARVTGSTSSEILGTLGTLQLVNGNRVASNANLFLINPKGIIFGRGVRLDVDRSFVATTANSIQFGNQGNFSATNPQEAGLLIVQPSALLFSQIHNGEIAVRSNALELSSGQSLLLMGGNVKVNGGATIAPDGRIELGGLSAPGAIGLSRGIEGLSTQFPNDVDRLYLC